MTSTIEPRYSSPKNYTPRALADKILAARNDVEGERKQVTALFADVVGFTSLSERLDPEDAHAVMRRCFDVMLEEVHRYEGTVVQFLGDGMFALVGAPLAHEDHAYRAVRAALGMQAGLAPYQRELHDGWGIDFQVRVGLNSGVVVVGNVARDLTMEYLAIGDTVNLASRVQALAQPGSVAISESTLRLVRGHFVTRDLGEHDVKGKQRAIRIHEAVRAVRWRSRVDVYAEAGLGPLVGRERELELLLDRARTALAGAGEVVYISGEPGIGKSRLLHELRSCLEQDEDVHVNWLVGRCVSYGADVAYPPIIDLLHDVVSIEEGDSDADRGRKLEEAAARLDAGPALPYLRHLLGVEVGDDGVAAMDPQLRKARIFDAVRRVLVATAEQAPTVITIEDLHWLDHVSTELLSYVIEAVAEKPILLVLTHRPEWKAPFGVRPNFTEIGLRSLTAAESARVAEFAVSAASLPPELEAFVHDKTEGNPFFVEEVVKSLVEAGVLQHNGSDSTYVLARPIEDVVVPDTIEGVIMARLDRLPEEPKRALQTAAVIGREFTIGLLERTANLEEVGDDYLRELKSVELIHERSLYPELAFMFRHALTHDVAYNSLLVQHRKALHRLVGAAIEDVYAEQLPENYETLAYHWEQAQDWSKALDYLVKSGHKALAAFAPSEAVRFFDRALAAVAADPGSFAPPRLIALHEGRGNALALLNEWDAGAASFQSMLAAAEGAADPAARGAALFSASSSLFLGHRFEEALDFAGSARELARETDDAAALAGSLVTFGGIRAVTGKLGEARGHLEEAKVAGGEAGAPLFEGLALMWSGFLDHWEGSERTALDAFTEGRRLGEEHGLPTLLLWTIWNQGLALCGRGRYEEALGTLEEHLELTKRLGDKFFRCRALNTLGWVYMDLCNWEPALDHNRRGVDESRELGDPEIIRNAELNVADCYLALEELDAAQEHLERVKHESAGHGARGEEWMKWRYTQHLHVSLGELFLARGDLERAQACAERCLPAAQDTRSRRNVVKARRLQAKVLLRGGHLAEAERELDPALQLARAVGNPAQLRETLAVVARLRKAQRRPQDALASYDEALAVVDGVARSLTRDQLAQTLLSSSQVQALRDARALAATSG